MYIYNVYIYIMCIYIYVYLHAKNSVLVPLEVPFFSCFFAQSRTVTQITGLVLSVQVPLGATGELVNPHEKYRVT
jgi:hypothetical protein